MLRHGRKPGPAAGLTVPAAAGTLLAASLALLLDTVSGPPGPAVALPVAPLRHRNSAPGAGGPACGPGCVGVASRRPLGQASAAAPASFTVRLVDAAGRPMPHRPLELYEDYHHGGCSSGVLLWKGTTDAGGRARLAQVASILPRDPATGGVGGGQVSFKIEVQGPGHGELRVPVSALRAGTLILRAPGVGRLVVTVTDPQGRAAAGVQVFVEAKATDQAKRSESIAAAVVDGDGRAVFAQLQAGLELEVGAWDPQQRWTPVTRAVHGPRPNETVRTVLAFSRTPVRVRGRLVDPGGAPIANCAFRVLRSTDDAGRRWGGAILQSGVSRFVVEPRTGRDGAFELRLRDPVGPGEHRLTVVVPDLARSGSTVLSLPRGRRSGVLDAGDIALAPSPILLHGRVLGEAGEPLAAARIELELRERSARAFYRIEGPDARGAFTVRGPAAWFAGRIDAQCKGYVSPGSRRLQDLAGEVELRLERAGAIRIGALLDSGYEGIAAGVEVDGEFQGLLPGEGPGDGTLIDGLRPGSKVVEVVEVLPPGRRLARFENVAVRAGAVTELPPVDLRGLARAPASPPGSQAARSPRPSASPVCVAGSRDACAPSPPRGAGPRRFPCSPCRAR